jgi:Ca2+-binding RTX toxin-like protein
VQCRQRPAVRRCGDDDWLEAGDGDDILTGGQGNDFLDGGNGSDTYVFGRGQGQDRISNVDKGTGSLDQIQFQVGISPEDVKLSRGGQYDNDLIISIKNTSDSVTIPSYFLHDSATIDQISFSDGTVWDQRGDRACNC